MGKEKLSATKVKAIVRMKELGFTVVKISELLGVSRVTVYDHINPEYYKARLERSASYRRRVRLLKVIKGRPLIQKEWELEA